MLTTIDQDILESTHLEDEIILQNNLINTISTNGLSKTAFSILINSSLLSNTSSLSIALESFDESSDIVAIESLAEKVKDNVAKWAAKALSFAKSSKDKIMSVFEDLYDKLKSRTKQVSSKVFDSAAESKKYAKAHPYKTISLAIAAAIAALAVGTLVINGFPVFKNAIKIPQFMKTVGSAIAKIKYPLGKITTAYKQGGTVIKLAIATGGVVAGIGTIAGLGWTKDKVVSTYNEYSKIKLNTETIVNGSTSLLKRTANAGIAFVKGIGSGISHGFNQGYYAGTDTPEPVRVLNGTLAMTFTTFCVLAASAVYLVYKLITGIVIGTLKVLCITLNALLGAKESEDEFL